MNRNFWKNKDVCVLGGASPIGNYLTEELVKLNPKDLWVVDNLSSGKREYVPGGVYFMQRDLREWVQASESIHKADVVFSLQCRHGGRGFVQNHPVECYDNLSLDSKVFRVCAEQGVEKVIFSSSACVYDVSLQQDFKSDFKIPEHWQTFNTPINSDGAYGESKAMSERILNAYIQSGEFEGVSCRFFTVISPKMNMTHAIGAMIARSIIKQDPYIIWGHKDVVRNWTWVGDTVNGMILSAEKMKTGVINIGSEERITMQMAVETIWDVMGWKPNEVKYLADKPVGIQNRVSDSTLAKNLLGWIPKISFRDGVEKVINYYLEHYNIDELKNNFERKLTEI